MSLIDSFENSDNVFLKIPHMFKPLQALNAVILAVCVGSTAGSNNGILWFVVILSLIVSAAATVLLALGIQDELLESVSNGKVQWNLVELVYSFIFAILSVICTWLAFGFANKSLYGTSAGYIATGLFSIVHTALYGIPCYLVYKNLQSNENETRNIEVQPAHPFRESAYQDL